MPAEKKVGALTTELVAILERSSILSAYNTSLANFGDPEWALRQSVTASYGIFKPQNQERSYIAEVLGMLWSSRVST